MTEIFIPNFFRLRWISFFNSTLPNFLFGSNASNLTPIQLAINGLIQALMAFFIVWLVVNLFVKVVKEIF